MKNPKLKYLKVVIWIICIVVMTLLIETIVSRHITSYEQRLDGSWNVNIDDRSYGQQDLSQYRFMGLKKGNVVKITRQLKQNEINGKTIKFLARYSYVRVYLDHKLVYQHGKEYYQKGSVLGNGYCWAVLPTVKGSQTISIVYDTSEDNAFSGLGDICLVDTEYAFLNHINCNIISLLLIAYMLVSGIFLIIASFFMEDISRMNSHFLMIGLFSIEASVWMACNTKVIEAITMDLHLICYMEYISMYAAFTTMVFLMAGFVNEQKKKKIFCCLGFALIGVDIVLVILNVTDVVHFTKSSHVFQIVSIIVFLILIANSIDYIRESKNEADQLIMIGIYSATVLVILEVLRYRYNRLVAPEYVLKQSLIPIGVVTFTIFVLAGFVYRMMERVEENIERKTLLQMAYTDSLTGISNRGKCEKVMMEIEDSNQPVTIINMDLDKFKEVNDSFGHMTGDKLLCDFAEILKDFFDDVICVGRMGGDEFIIVMDYLDDDKMNEKLLKFEECIQSQNEKKNRPYKIMVSIGYASDESGTSNPWQVYKEADKNMYQHKNGNK